MNRMLGQPASLLTQEPVPEHTPVVEERPAPSSPAPALDQNRPEVQPPAPEPSFNFLQVNTVPPCVQQISRRKLLRDRGRL